MLPNWNCTPWTLSKHLETVQGFCVQVSENLGSNIRQISTNMATYFPSHKHPNKTGTAGEVRANS